MGRKARLSDEQILAIRRGGRPDAEFAAEFGVSTVTIWKAKARKAPYNYEIDNPDQMHLIFPDGEI